MAHDESSAQDDPIPDNPAVPPQSGSGPEPNATPKSNAINMTLLELQGDNNSADSPAPPTEPARPASEPTAPESRLTTPLVENPVAAPVPPAPQPEPESVAAAREPLTVEPTSAPVSGTLSSTPPIAGRLERPSQRPTPTEPHTPLPATENGPSLTTVLIAAAVVSLAFGLLGAWTYDHFFQEGKPPIESAVASEPSAPDVVAPPSLSTAELKPLKTRLGELGEQVDAFEKQLDEASSQPSATTDLAPIRQQIDGVAKAVATIDPLSKQLEGINARIEGLETSLNGLKEDLGSLETKTVEPEKGNDPPSATPTSNTPTPVPAAAEPSTPAPLTLENADANLENNALSEGVELFKLGKYQQAYNFFEKLEKTNEKDARVWYYAALSYGLASGDWGETTPTTTNLVKKGVEREKAGSPKSSEIDAFFRDLDTGTGKEWLAFQRKNVTK
ncbi:hypothetical protein SAMN05444166_0491 [Singulisphaera sp. GP187]|uniref:hypothetical protein n=1 Tax=Singulisphaera sp. GP187 TaxID=1882752 RepID=UPI00092C9806|nr:hypothetical protein [Singulisphaera sp. GP187]SIN73033.1 hypothetical protein SAMN05444166_0491 [Singulisphaera sp. GP187]